jgi:hypothetical protein
MLDVRLVSLHHECFPPLLRVGFRLDVRQVSLYHKCFPPSLQKRVQVRNQAILPLSCVFPSLLRGALISRQTSLSLSCVLPSLLMRRVWVRCQASLSPLRLAPL